MSVSEMHNNVYLVTCTATGEQLLIDAADDAHRCLLLVREGTGRLDHLVTTHQHWDHVRALEEVARATGATTYAGADDADALPVAPDVRLRHGDVVTVGELELDVIHLAATPRVRGPVVGGPGRHAHLFTGDSLFPGGVGPTTTPRNFDRPLTTTSSSGCSPPTTTTPGSTPGTATTRRSGRSDPTREWRERGW